MDACMVSIWMQVYKYMLVCLDSMYSDGHYFEVSYMCCWYGGSDGSSSGGSNDSSSMYESMDVCMDACMVSMNVYM